MRHGPEVEALIDTGASISAVSQDVFDQIKVKAGQERAGEILDDITAVNGESMAITGCYELQMRVRGRNITGTFFVLPNLQQQMIVGVDIINDVGINYFGKEKKVTVDPDPDDDESEIFVRKRTVIPANCSAAVKVKVPYESKLRTEGPVIAAISSRRSPVAGADAVVNMSRKGTAMVRIDNLLDVDLVLPRGLRVGRVEAVDLEKCEVLDLSKAPAEEEPGNTKCDPEKEAMLRETLREQVKELPKDLQEQYIDLVLKNHDVFSKDKMDLGKAWVMEHEIRLKDEEPCFRKQFRMPEEHRSVLLKHLENWLKLGVVSPSKSHYNSPIFMVLKKDGSLRPVLDFRDINEKSFVDKYSAREVQDCLDEIGRERSTIFTCLDLTCGFWQMPLEEKSRKCTAFTIPGKGSFEWNRVPMGLLGSPASFGRMMEFIMAGLQVITYQDDLLIHTKAHAEQIEQLQRVFNRLRANGLKLNAKKCEFGQKEVPYLGFTLTEDGVKPGKDKTQAIRECKPPRTVRQVREFTGLCNYFRASVKDFAAKAAPLNKLTSKNSDWKGGDLPPEALLAFEALRSSLVSPEVLAYPDPQREYHLVVDAAIGSDEAPGGLGASLIQFDDEDRPRAVGFASRGLIKHENNYSAFLLEMQACVFGIEYFQVYLTGRHFYLYSDHKPLEKLSAVHKRTLNRLQQMMMEYDFTIRFKPGQDNAVADYLSRNPLAAVDVNKQGLIEVQEQDEFVQRIRKQLEEDSEEGQRAREHFVDEYGILFRKKNDGGRAIVAAQSMVPAIMKAAHDSRLGGHLGCFKTRERILDRYYWPTVRQDVEEHVRSCTECAKVKPWSKPARVPLKPLELAETPNHRIHVDLFGPLKTTSEGKKYVCVMTDAFSKYVEVEAIADKSAKTVAKTIMETWVTRYSTPKEIVTDGGKEFANELLNELCKELGILHKTTTPYHPQTNGAVEVFNRTMKHFLATAIEAPFTDWECLLPALRLCYNTSVSKATQMTPFSLVYGMEANMPFFDLEESVQVDGRKPEFLQRLAEMREKAREANLEYQSRAQKQYDRKFKTENRKLKKGDFIYVENMQKSAVNPKLQPSWLGPFEVIERDEVNVKYQQGKKVKAAHLNRVKTANIRPKSPEDEVMLTQSIMKAVSKELKKQSKRDRQEFVKIPRSLVMQESRRSISETSQESETGKNPGPGSDYTTQSDEESAGARNPRLHESESEWSAVEQDHDGEHEAITNFQELSKHQWRERARESSDEEWEITAYDTPLPESPLPRTPRAGAYRVRRESSEEEMDTLEKSHAFQNEVVMKTVKKRKPTSPAGRSEPKQACAEGRTLRSSGTVLQEQPIPSRPLEWKPRRKVTSTTGGEKT